MLSTLTQMTSHEEIIFMTLQYFLIDIVNIKI